MVFQTYQRYNFESKSQQTPDSNRIGIGCFRPIKDTILRANHNRNAVLMFLCLGVSDLSKIQFWEQITTLPIIICLIVNGVSDLSKIQFWEQITTRGYATETYTWCFRPIKDTILRANHNLRDDLPKLEIGVSDLSKIQFWEQITTDPSTTNEAERCFRPIKDTILRANHNRWETE